MRCYMVDRKKKMLRRNGYLAAVCALLLAGMLSGCAGGGDGGAQSGAPSENAQQAESGGSQAEAAQDGEEGQEASVSFEARDMEGNAVTADIFGQSRLTMVNVWATYCNPCLSEMPDLGELAGEYDTADFQLIGIISDVPEIVKGVDEEKAERAMEEARSLIESTEASYTHLPINASLQKALLADVTAVPTTFFVDGEGKVRGTVVGARDKESWKELIDALLAEL